MTSSNIYEKERNPKFFWVHLKLVFFSKDDCIEETAFFKKNL